MKRMMPENIMKMKERNESYLGYYLLTMLVVSNTSDNQIKSLHSFLYSLYDEVSVLKILFLNIYLFLPNAVKILNCLSKTLSIRLLPIF